MFVDSFDDGDYAGWTAEASALGGQVVPENQAVRLSGTGPANPANLVSLRHSFGVVGDFSTSAVFQNTGVGGPGWRQGLELSFAGGVVTLWDIDGSDRFEVTRPGGRTNFGDVAGLAGEVGLAVRLGVSRTGKVLTFTAGAAAGSPVVVGSLDLGALGELTAVRLRAGRTGPSGVGFQATTDDFRLETPSDTLTWIASGGGEWNDGGNWSLGRPPQANEDAVIDRPGATVTVTGPAVARSLTTTAALNVAGSLALGASSSISGALGLTGTLSVAANATLALSGGGNLAGTLHVADGATAHLTAGLFTLVTPGSVIGPGKVKADGTATLQVDANKSVEKLEVTGQASVSGTADLTVTDSFRWSGGLMEGTGRTIVVNGAGTVITGNHKTLRDRTLVLESLTVFSPTGADLTLQGNATIENAGTFDITTGFSILADGTNTVIKNSGTFKKTDGDASSVQGRFVNTGKVIADVLLNFADLRQSGQPAEITASSADGIRAGVVTLLGGKLILGAGSTFELDWSLAPAGAGASTLSGLTVEGAADAKIRTDAASTVNIAGTLVFNDVTIDSDSRWNWVAGNIQSNDAVFNNKPGAVFDVLADNSWFGAGTSRFLNNATFRKSAGTGTTTLNLTNFDSLNAAGGALATVEVNAGEVSFQGGGASDGRFTVAAGSELRFEKDAAFEARAGASFDGDGWVKVIQGEDASARITVGDDVVLSFTNLALASLDALSPLIRGQLPNLGDTLEGITISESLEWRSGVVELVGIRVEAGAGATLGQRVLGADVVFRSAWMLNLGMTEWEGSNISLLRASVGGVDMSASSIMTDGSQGDGNFIVATFGTPGSMPQILGNANGPEPIISVSNDGRFGRLGPHADGAITHINVAVLNQGGWVQLDDLRLKQFRQFSGTTVLSFGTGATTGDFMIEGGQVDLAAGTTLDVGQMFSFTDGIVRLENGTVKVGLRFEIEPRAILKARGTIYGRVQNSGTIHVGGDDIGKLTIRGEFQNVISGWSTFGTLFMDIAGTNPGMYDNLEVLAYDGLSGNVAIGGTLSVGPHNGFTPVANDVFALIVGASRTGTFASIEKRGAFASLNLTADYSIPNTFRLKN